MTKDGRHCQAPEGVKHTVRTTTFGFTLKDRFMGGGANPYATTEATTVAYRYHTQRRPGMHHLRLSGRPFGDAQMQVRQSDLKSWQKCPLIVRYDKVDGLRRLQSGSLTFGSIIHHCTQVMEETRDLEAALLLFKQMWLDPSLLGDEYPIDYYVRGTNWKKFMDEGPRVLTDWWGIFSWDTDLVLAREYTFEVPIGDGHTLSGTIDKLKVVYRADIDEWVLLISDYKTNKKNPTYGYLSEDLQFSAYCYATTRPEFWANLPGGRGLELMAQYQDHKRYGQWVALMGPKTMDAGIREQRHYNRLTMAVNAYALSFSMRIFVPTISGESCLYCDFRKQCGLPELMEEPSW